MGENQAQVKVATHAIVWDRAIQLVDSFEVLNEEIQTNDDLHRNALIREIVAVLIAARDAPVATEQVTADKATKQDLLPCPFCGGQPVRGMFSAWCGSCGAQTVNDSDATKEVIDARWNTRAVNSMAGYEAAIKLLRDIESVGHVSVRPATDAALQRANDKLDQVMEWAAAALAALANATQEGKETR